MENSFYYNPITTLQIVAYTTAVHPLCHVQNFVMKTLDKKGMKLPSNFNCDSKTLNELDQWSLFSSHPLPFVPNKSWWICSWDFHFSNLKMKAFEVLVCCVYVTSNSTRHYLNMNIPLALFHLYDVCYFIHLLSYNLHMGIWCKWGNYNSLAICTIILLALS